MPANTGDTIDQPEPRQSMSPNFLWIVLTGGRGADNLAGLLPGTKPNPSAFAEAAGER
jgi:hypothetical protein